MAAIVKCECLLWVTTGHDAVKSRCPLFPRKQTFIEAVGMSAMGQKQTFRHSFNHLVGGHKQRLRYSEAKGLGGSQVNSQIELD
jgi:hypothetical protein